MLVDLGVLCGQSLSVFVIRKFLAAIVTLSDGMHFPGVFSHSVSYPHSQAASIAPLAMAADTNIALTQSQQSQPQLTNTRQFKHARKGGRILLLMALPFPHLSRAG